ncbi:MAG: CRISPR system precrRNA processing endoribonuclease RAMP protein Cas6 [candidate division WOR-3 bacterium]
MPIKFKIYLKLDLPKKKEEVVIQPDVLHGFFFSLLSSHLAGELHKPSRYKPFSIWAPNLFKFNLAVENQEENIVPVTISLLKDDLFPVIVNQLYEAQKKLFLGPYKVSLIKESYGIIKNDLYLSYEEILQTEPKPYLSFLFLTPTTFKKGAITYPLPDPKVVFKGLIKKWNRFSPHRIPVDLRSAIEEKLYIVFAKIRTHKISLSLGGFLIGFTGRVLYGGKTLTQEELKWINILGTFSNFSGIGKKTTMNFGMTEFVGIDEEVYHEEETNLSNR